MKSTAMHRQGTLLLIVAGLSAMLAVLGTTYLSTLRSRTADNDRNFIDAQARLLVYAAAAFIAERQGIISSGAHPNEVAFPLVTVDRAVGGPPFTAVRRDSPHDTWFRIVMVDPTTFTVTVGIGLTRGLRDATDRLNITSKDPMTVGVDLVHANALGLPLTADLPTLAATEHREFYRVRINEPIPGAYVTEITRLGAAPGTW